MTSQLPFSLRQAFQLEMLSKLEQARTRTKPFSQTGWWHGGARPSQLPPSGDWRLWLLLAGRGFGKSRAVNEWAIEQARKYPGSRGALVASTAADARDVIVEGESGILNIASPDFMPLYEPSKRRLTFPNGSIATTFSADEPKRLRGPQFHWAICDELAAWNYGETFDMLLMGVRLGTDPRIAIATTPRPTAVVKRLLKDPTCIVTKGNTYENADNLAPQFLDAILARYEGTRLGRQEIHAEVIDDVEGALWTHGMIDAARVPNVPALSRVVVGVDPAVTNTADSDETGIVVAGVAMLNGVLHGYVFEDASLRASPEQWARRAVQAYHDHDADRLVAEVNNGGDMVGLTIRTVDANVSFKKVHASRGKMTRAEPVAALYEQQRVHHVGVLAKLEDQMTSWSPLDAYSPDRVDALVWCLTELMLGGAGEMKIGNAPPALSEWFGA